MRSPFHTRAPNHRTPRGLASPQQSERQTLKYSSRQAVSLRSCRLHRRVSPEQGAITDRLDGAPCASRSSPAFVDRPLPGHGMRTRNPASPHAVIPDVNRFAVFRSSRSSGERRVPDWPSWSANSSVNRENALNLRNVFSVFKSVGEHTKRQGFHP